MSRKHVVCIVVGTLLLLLTAMVAGAFDRRDWARDIDRMRYNVAAERVYEGTVGSKGHVVDGLVYFALRTTESTVQVQIGPEEFVERSGLTLKIGETVTVVGVLLRWNGRDTVLAREVSTMTSIFEIRDREGYPQWDLNRPIEMDPNLSPSPLCRLLIPSS